MFHSLRIIIEMFPINIIHKYILFMKKLNIDNKNRLVTISLLFMRSIFPEINNSIYIINIIFWKQNYSFISFSKNKSRDILTHKIIIL